MSASSHLINIGLYHWRLVAMTRSMGYGVLLVLGLIMILQLQQGAQAQSCGGQDLNKLSVCLPAATANVMPSAACCQNLGAFQNSEACLCAASANPRFTASGAKKEFALLIPQKCNLKFKAGYVCNGKKASKQFIRC